jgi:hypothetical protein
MAFRPNPLLIVSEAMLLLLGGLLIMLAVTRTISVPSTALMVIFGIVLVYWALRAWMRREPASARLQTHVRAGSLVIVGLLIISIPLLPLSDANLLVAAAGAVLVLRGLLAGLLSMRRA